MSPSGVGYDIGCGNKAARTELTRDDLDALGGVEALMREITRRISFGMGVPAPERVDHPVLDQIRNADFAPQRQLAQLAESQLGTVGSGNHYVNLMEDEEGRVWVGVHFGSRGFGHKTASGFLALAQGLAFDERARRGRDGLAAGAVRGRLRARRVVRRGDGAGRRVRLRRPRRRRRRRCSRSSAPRRRTRCTTTTTSRGGRSTSAASTGSIRKGCTPARPGQEGFVGGSMGDESVILEGVESPDDDGVAATRRCTARAA